MEGESLAIPRGLSGWLGVQWARLVDQPPMRIGSGGASRPSAGAIEAVLGMLATAHEPLSADQLATFLSALAARDSRGTGRQPAIGRVRVDRLRRQMGAVLGLAEEFFDQPGREPSLAAPKRFFHTAIPAFVLGKLPAVMRRECDWLLARACDHWRDYPQAERDYAAQVSPGPLDCRAAVAAGGRRVRRRGVHHRAEPTFGV